MSNAIKSSKSWFVVALVFSIFVFNAQSSLGASSSQEQFMKGLKLYANWAPIPWRKAFSIFELDSGTNPNSTVFLARLYQTGRGVTKDENMAQQISKKAFPKVKKLAEGGNATSQFVLGMMYKAGLGTEKNFEKALKWFESSAKLGFKVVHWELTAVFHNGLTGKKDWTKAIEHSKKCSSILSICSRTIGLYYFWGGNGVTKN